VNDAGLSRESQRLGVHPRGPATTLDSGESDPDLGQHTVIEPPPPRVASSKPTSTEARGAAARNPPAHERPTLARLPEERPVPTVPFPAPDLPPAERPTSQSSPTLSVTEHQESELAPPPPKLGGADGPSTDRQPASVYAQAVAAARNAREDQRQQRQLGTRVLIVGLIAAGVVAVAILVALLQ
jgi:hypothetical protein